MESTDVTVHVLREIRDEIREAKDLLSDRLEIRDRVERCEREIDWLKSRVGRPAG